MSFVFGGNQSSDKILLTHGIISKMGLHNTSIPFPVWAGINICILCLVFQQQLNKSNYHE